MGDCHTEWLAAMRAGDFAAAWSVSDRVLAARDPATRDDPHLPYHLRWVWDGRSLRGATVLVRCYHGLGDTLQFARYLPLLRGLAAGLTVEAPPALIPLLAQGLIPRAAAGQAGGTLIPFRPAFPTPAARDIEIMELCHALRLSPLAVPPPYLAVPPSPTPPGAIGLCWRASAWDADRSIPTASLAPIAASWPCVSLQPGPAHLPLLNPQGCPTALIDTAALIAGLDLVITVDTMVAHLAGALDRPTWLLLKHDADWRWMAKGRHSPWYPRMRLYRQPHPGDWAGVIKQVMADLSARRAPGPIERMDGGLLPHLSRE